MVLQLKHTSKWLSYKPLGGTPFEESLPCSALSFWPFSFYAFSQYQVCHLEVLVSVDVLERVLEFWLKDYMYTERKFTISLHCVQMHSSLVYQWIHISITFMIVSLNKLHTPLITVPVVKPEILKGDFQGFLHKCSMQHICLACRLMLFGFLGALESNPNEDSLESCQ